MINESKDVQLLFMKNMILDLAEKGLPCFKAADSAKLYQSAEKNNK
jgi:hypothetical protein